MDERRSVAESIPAVEDDWFWWSSPSWHRHRDIVLRARCSSYVPVTLISDRAGLVMDSGGKVKLRGVEIGRVAADHGRRRLRCDLNSRWTPIR